MKQPSKKQSTRESRFDPSSGNLDHIIASLDEGTAADLGASMTAAITKVCNNIEAHAGQRGLSASSKWLTDGQAVAAVVGIQLGHRRAYPNSEEISVRIFDDDNIKVILTDNLTRTLEAYALNKGITLKQLTVFNSEESAMDFLEAVYDGVGAVNPNS